MGSRRRRGGRPSEGGVRAAAAGRPFAKVVQCGAQSERAETGAHTTRAYPTSSPKIGLQEFRTYRNGALPFLR